MAQGAAIAATLGGGMIQAKGIMDEAQSADTAARYNATQDRYNAQIVQQQAAADEQKLRNSARKTIATARANYGASGVTLEGSATDVLQESAANAEMDAMNVRYGGYTKALAYRNQADLELYKGGEGVRAAQTKAAAALIGAGGKAYGMT